ncbi:DUF411 domain-containing protein [Indioceanicola profundi]|uniref:DUF411 domain-containing protein n=1 Tax=Indioceanicola profundi TaxID=2220096 RepID=UPI000E6AD270|nr:DUF411 domain-containing protein [Indioceanicola profundi]
MTASRRAVLTGLGAGTAILTLSGLGIALAPSEARAELPKMSVWKDPSCGCCGAWVDHVRAAGFQVDVRESTDMAAIKQVHQVPPQLQSCHTALVDGYVLEGHVPAEDVLRLIKERPAAKGLTVPGMPQGSPGMETGHKDAYDVILFGGEGGDKVFASH